VPWQCAGSTDAKHLIPLGVPVYGFVPAKPLPEGLKGAGAHANDERIWLDNVTFALEVLFDVVYRFCAT
jgi:acetylornithine deacetylase/succinyl-diaminopimelate desuccinylase-like protein